MLRHEDVVTDVLVIGAGAAGLRASIEARRTGVDVMLASKMPPNFPNTSSVAAGWITCVEERFKGEALKLMVEEGCYLNNQSLVEAFVEEAPFRIPELRNLGVKLEVDENPSELMFNRPAKQYLCVAAKGPGGAGLIKPLKALAEDLEIKVLYNLIVTRLLTYNGSVVGAIAISPNDRSLLTIKAKAVILATGGGAEIYGRTDNPPGTTGDGYAIAYRAGAKLIDMEFIEFAIPTVNLESIFKTELSKGVSEMILSRGVCHYFLGGVKVDEKSRSSLKGLYAAGEVTGGLFGASRLGGSALADAIISGARAGLNAARWVKTVEADIPKPNLDQLEEERNRLDELLKHGSIPPASIRHKISKVMWRMCGVIKNSETMMEAYEELKRLEDKASRMHATGMADLKEALEVLNMLDVAKIIVKAASMRKESRGAHWRTDHKEPNNDWLRNLIVSLYKGEPKVEARPVRMTKLKMPFGWRPRIGTHCSGYLTQAR